MPRARPPRCSGRSDGSPGQEFRVDASRRSCPRRTGETVRVTDPDGSVEWAEVEDFSRSGSGGPALRLGFGVRCRSGSGPGSDTPTGRCASTAGSRATARRSRSPATGYGGGAAGNVGARTLTVLRSSVPVHLRLRQPARRDRRGRRGNGCGGQDPRAADPAHRPTGRHRRRFRAADAGVIDRGRPGPVPAVGDRAGPGAAAGGARGADRPADAACSTTSRWPRR